MIENSITIVFVKKILERLSYNQILVDFLNPLKIFLYHFVMSLDL